jgi:tetratricopeptide (TPR) repeat protein
VSSEVPAGHQELEDEREFLLRSIDDLEREREAGDLAEEDYEHLRDVYVARAAEVLRALDAVDSKAAGGGSKGDPPDADLQDQKAGIRLTGRARRTLVWSAVVLFSVAAVVLVTLKLTNRLPGEFATGSLTLSPGELVQRRLAQAAVLEQQGQYAEALRVYQQILAADPRQPSALAEAGWLEYEAGTQAKSRLLVSKGEQLVSESVSVAPSSYAGHLYLGTIYLYAGHLTDSVAQYRSFLADHPPSSILSRARPFVAKAFSEAGIPVPASLGSG